VGLTFDIGHAAIVAAVHGTDPLKMLAAVADDVVLFHVHDNFGARAGGDDAPGVDPIKLDLHLPPGAGRVPWSRLAPVLLESSAPLLLEVHAPHRPEPLSLADVTLGVLLRQRPPVAA
jgi:sugar phosphate isomerase/epimerase